MTTEDQILELALGERRAWVDHLRSLSHDDLAEFRDKIPHILEYSRRMAESLELAMDDVEHEIKIRDEQREKAERKARRTGRKVSLREFLSRPPLAENLPLSDLRLCTKSGARVSLKGLFFRTAEGDHEIKEVNDAKALFQKGVKPSACWDLHYVRNGQDSAGFGWDRPFLDEVFVLEEC